MPSTSSIGASLIRAAQQVSGGSSQFSPAATAQEAAETQAQTAKEARNGDPVAKRKLAQLAAKQAQQTQAEAPPAQESGKGTAFDHVA